MNDFNQDRGTLAAAMRRVDVGDVGEAAVQESFDQTMADIRDAAIWNTLLTAKEHGRSRDITAEDVARWRRIRAETDAIAGGANEHEVVPAGFGPPVRTQHAALLARAAINAAKARRPAETELSGGMPRAAELFDGEPQPDGRAIATEDDTPL